MIWPNFDLSILDATLVAVLGYLLGSIPFGMVLARIMGLGNLRDIGSGNIGATNVLRTGNKLAAALTLAFDMGKGAVAALIAHAFFGETAALIAGFWAFIGHCFPIWLRGKGGKGVATFIGVILAFHFWVGLATCATWLAGAWLTRISSAAALIAAALTPIWLWIAGAPHMIGVALLLELIIIWKHRPNIDRILIGAEPRIGKK